jgi:FSR family fosmidomycin resistance protein-like MFS transporter
LNLRALLCLALIHTLVDSYAQFVSPLWPRLRDTLGLEPRSFTLLFAAWQVSTSVSQPLFGYWGDRFGSRWMVALGPVLAVLCLGSIGFATSGLGVALLLTVGGFGIGAFHPEAAAGVAEAAGAKLTNGLALFTFGGMLGLGIGPFLSGVLVEAYGLESLAWTVPPGLLLLGSLLLLYHPARHAALPRASAAGLADLLGGRVGPVLLLLGVATLRVVPALGVPLGLAFVLKQRGLSEAEIGWSQSVFLLSGGFGTLACPLLARPGRELAALAGTMIPAAGCLVLVTARQPLPYYLGLAGAGLFLQGAVPILISYSQRLLPRGRRVGASLTLGTSWGLGGLIVAGLQAYYTSIDRLEGMLWALVPFALVAALGSCLLPRLDKLPAGRPSVADEAALEAPV